MSPTIEIDISAHDGLAVARQAGHRYRSEPWSGKSYVRQRTPTFTVVVEHVGADTVLREAEVGIYGVGPNLREAWADFQAAVRQHRDVLERQDQLSEDLAHQLAYLRARIQS